MIPSNFGGVYSRCWRIYEDSRTLGPCPLTLKKYSSLFFKDCATHITLKKGFPKLNNKGKQYNKNISCIDLTRASYSPAILLAVQMLPTLPLSATAVSGVSCHSQTRLVTVWVSSESQQWDNAPTVFCHRMKSFLSSHIFRVHDYLSPGTGKYYLFVRILMYFRIKRVFYRANLKIYGNKRISTT